MDLLDYLNEINNNTEGNQSESKEVNKVATESSNANTIEENTNQSIKSGDNDKLSNTQTVILNTVKQTQSNKKNAAPTTKSNDKNKSNPIKDKNEFKIDESTIIRYQGQSIEITKLLSVDKIKNGVTENGKTRKKNEKDILKLLKPKHPELDPQIAKIICHSKKNLLIPHVPGHKNGLVNKELTDSLESVSSFKLNIKNNRLFLGNKNVLIPEELIYEFIQIARGYSEEYGVEVKGEIYFSLIKKQYILNIPRQTVSRVLIEVDELTLDEAIEISDMIKLMEIHSHHVFEPIPSQTDIKYDRSCGLYYAIIGNINSLFPDITVRILNKETGKYEYIMPVEIIEKKIRQTSDTPQVNVLEGQR